MLVLPRSGFVQPFGQAGLRDGRGFSDQLLSRRCPLPPTLDLLRKSDATRSITEARRASCTAVE